MNFKDQMAADAAIFFNQNEFAEPVQYNGKTIFVIPEIGEGVNRGQPDPRRGMAFFDVQKVDVPDPKTGDVILYSNKEWEFSEIISTDSISHTLKFYAGESATWVR